MYTWKRKSTPSPICSLTTQSSQHFSDLEDLLHHPISPKQKITTEILPLTSDYQIILTTKTSSQIHCESEGGGRRKEGCVCEPFNISTWLLNGAIAAPSKFKLSCACVWACMYSTCNGMRVHVWMRGGEWRCELVFLFFFSFTPQGFVARIWQPSSCTLGSLPWAFSRHPNSRATHL